MHKMMTGINGWRTVIIQSHDSVRLKDNCLVVICENAETAIPLDQIREILINSNRGSISLPLLIKLIENNIHIIFCDNKMNPLCETGSLYSHFESSGRQMDQASWTNRKKQSVWKKIVKMKISRQIELISLLNLEVDPKLKEYKKNILSDDITNREAMAARIYFNILFGPEFIRFSADNINAALNYGYSILQSAFNRAIVMNGYNTKLGIHHCNRQNPYNLSSDLMEPFRPFIDRIVYNNISTELDWDYKMKLIHILYDDCMYNDKITSVQTAIELFIRNVCNVMNKTEKTIKEIGFVRK